MIFPPKKLIPFSLLQEQSTQERAPNKASAHDGQRPNGNWHFQTTKEIAPTKESATTGLRPRQSGLKISILQTFSFGVDLLDAVSSTLPVAQWAPLVLTLDRLSISIFICYSCAARWPSKAPAGHCKGCLENVWSHSRTFRNRQAHITHGNQFCQRCSLFLGTWYYYNLPSKFRSQPVTLSNGMMVHHFRICSHHVSIWFFVEDTVFTRIFLGTQSGNCSSCSKPRGPPEACRETTAFPLRSNISSISVMSSDLHIQQVVTNPAVRRGGNIEPIKICALKAPGIVVSSPFKLSVVVRAKLTDSGKQPCAVL
jgi:hypothetical protein